ncbi:MAG TPA: hypothetical protein VES89_01010, partial [Candidatus Competibacteraceae bacterium]|nr:hypothetical protein [Candidatus Competibacteraceae bacterium]
MALQARFNSIFVHNKLRPTFRLPSYKDLPMPFNFEDFGQLTGGLDSSIAIYKPAFYSHKQSPDA